MNTGESPHALLARQLHVVSGKGGVGKSAFACTLARRFERAGLRTLLLQINAADSHSRMLGLAHVDHVVRQARPHLSVANLEPEASLHEYLVLKLKVKKLVDVLLHNHIARSFLRFVPSLAELNMLGKLWFHAEERDAAGRPRFDRIVVDAPATGHGLTFLAVARAVHATVPGGPMARETGAMSAMLEDTTRTALHIVTLPEEMPVNESLEMIAAVRAQRLAPLGFLVANRVPRALFQPGDAAQLAAAKAASSDPAHIAALDVALTRAARDHHVASQLARLSEAEPGMAHLRLPRLSSPQLSPVEMDRLAAHLPDLSTPRQTGGAA